MYFPGVIVFSILLYQSVFIYESSSPIKIQSLAFSLPNLIALEKNRFDFYYASSVRGKKVFDFKNKLLILIIANIYY